MFHPDYWGQGYATEALNAFVNKVWEMLPEVEKLSALTDSENEGSKGVLRKCGFLEVRRGPYVNATMGERVEVKFEDVRPK
jgi:RimJ/RimL family protein N-acetyltransferase